MNVPNSIYGGDERERSIHSTAVSVAATPEIEFDFDDQIFNSRVYRRVLAREMTKTMHVASDVEAIEGDLNDFSDAATMKETGIQKEETSAAARLSEGLVVPQGRENAPVEENVNKLNSKYWLAMTLHKQERHTEAEGLFRETAQGQETVLGKEHVDTLYTMHWLARTLYYQQRYTEAEEFYRKATQGQEKVLGKEHIQTFYSKDSLAMTLYDQQKYIEAEGFFRETAQGREKVLGKEHDDTLHSKYWLALTLHKQEKYTEAEGLFRETAQGRS